MNINNIIITKADLPDVEEITQLWSAIDQYASPRPFGGDKTDIKIARTREMIKHAINTQLACVLKATLDKRIIGTISGHIFERPTAKLSSIGVIYSLWVENDYRNNGIGKSLLASIEKSLHLMGADALQVGWDTPNTYAGDWWQKQGYTPYETIASKIINS
ncbi:MAG: GNAT family N-acetyltransferase [Cellvibrionaceae bacterium]